ncbi:hypothetical protein [Deinococcus sp. NW-56]|uniref:hypothetical protein n=1 Tax=Deinococcus sp. NW-56 TaxID=2080419 RepID=UPI000CF51192|nr:hypothetical protein [Deinococcus sp. NW-56]
MGTIYAVTQDQQGSADVTTTTGQVRLRPILVGLYGAAPTLAGRNQLAILLAWLHHRAREVDRHPGLQVVDCTSADDLPPTLDSQTRQHYAHIRFYLRYQQGVRP